MRLLFLTPLLLALGACGGMDSLKELAKTEISVNAPRDEVFDTAFNVDELAESLSLVSNTGTDQQFEMIVDEQTPGWEAMKPDAVPFARKIKVTMTLEDRRDAKLRYSINDGAVKTGVTWHFEDVPGGGTKVSFDLMPLEGDRTEGLTINRLELRQLARKSLDKIERMAKDRGPATING
ncbi:MAG: SRPBCC family protein [Sphingopyxis sp.]|nr:SRPBCC family protein [Sphingopyxis sp.]